MFGPWFIGYVMNKLYNSFHPLLFWFGECLFVWLSVSDFLLFAPKLADVGHNFCLALRGECLFVCFLSFLTVQVWP